MTWTVAVDKSVRKFLKCIPQRDAVRMREVLRQFPIDPFAGDIIKLSGEENSWRRRVGAYRIFFEVFDDLHTILIQEIQRRGSNTY